MNDLELVIRNNDIEPEKSQILLKSFGQSFREAQEIVAGIKTIKVKDEFDIASMKLAREARLKLRSTRTKAEKIRKKLKEASLRESRAIDGIANIIKALIIPAEEYLEEQEKYAIRLREIRLAKIEKDREDKISQYVENIDVYNLSPEVLSDTAFKILLKNAKSAYAAQQEALRIEKENRLREEQEAKDEQERTRKENEQLKVAAQRREAEFQKREAEIEHNRKLEEARLHRIEEDYRAEQERLSAENDRLIKEAALKEKQAQADVEGKEAERYQNWKSNDEQEISETPTKEVIVEDLDIDTISERLIDISHYVYNASLNFVASIVNSHVNHDILKLQEQLDFVLPVLPKFNDSNLSSSRFIVKTRQRLDAIIYLIDSVAAFKRDYMKEQERLEQLIPDLIRRSLGTASIEIINKRDDDRHKQDIES